MFLVLFLAELWLDCLKIKSNLTDNCDVNHKIDPWFCSIKLHALSMILWHHFHKYIERSLYNHCMIASRITAVPLENKQHSNKPHLSDYYICMLDTYFKCYGIIAVVDLDVAVEKGSAPLMIAVDSVLMKVSTFNITSVIIVKV